MLRRSPFPQDLLHEVLCLLCLETDPDGGLENHLQAHSNGDVPCPLCSARVLGDVVDHLTLFHDVTSGVVTSGQVTSGDVIGWCAAKDCGSSFACWADHVQHLKRRHWQSIHPGRVCRLCLRILGSVHEARRHLEFHACARTTHFPCKWCEAQFFTAAARKDHMLYYHRR